MTKDRFDVHQHITNQIISAIESGAGEFKLPWHTGSGSIMRPTNIASKKPYRGVNIVALWAASHHKSFLSGIWGTYRQWAEAGAQVRKGEKSSFVVFYKEITVGTEPADGSSETDGETRLFARATPVFAAEQVEGFDLPTPPQPSTIELIAAADRLVATTGASVAHGGSQALPPAIHRQHPASDARELHLHGDKQCLRILLLDAVARTDALDVPRHPARPAARQALRRRCVRDGRTGSRTWCGVPVR